MSCLANNKRVLVCQALLFHPASSSFIQPRINRKPYPLYWASGGDGGYHNKPAMGQHQIGIGRGRREGNEETLRHLVGWCWQARSVIRLTKIQESVAQRRDGPGIMKLGASAFDCMTWNKQKQIDFGETIQATLKNSMCHNTKLCCCPVMQYCRSPSQT